MFLLQRKSEAKSLLKTIENKRKILISLGAPAAGNSNSATNVANADTSSDGDMDMELSDYKFNEYMSNRASMGGVAPSDTSVSFKSSANTTNEVGTSTNLVTTDVHHRKVVSIVADDMSLSESNMTANTSIATTNTPSNIYSRRTLASTSNPAHNIIEGGEDNDNTNSLEMSSISID